MQINQKVDSRIRPVIEQLKAYNNRDIDGFIVNFAEDCLVEDGMGHVIMEGKATMYESYKQMFELSPKLHCQLASRTLLETMFLMRSLLRDELVMMESLMSLQYIPLRMT